MHNKVLDIIKCPECYGIEFYEINLPAIANFNMSAALVCKKCSQLYVIHNEILSLIKPGLADKERELAFIQIYFSDLPEVSSKKRIQALQNEIQKNNNIEWVLSEKKFWDQKKYGKESIMPVKFSWDRFEVRKQHIINHIKDEVKDKIVIEFGSGNSGTLYHVMNPEKFGYTLVCTDFSYNVLLVARRLHPTAIVIQCDAIDPPFRDGVIDVILDFGILHHLPNNENVLENHTKLLKRQGYLGLHEPIDRRPPFLSSIRFFNKFKGEQSEHNDFINESVTVDYLKEHGRILHQHLEYSPVRNWMVNLFVNFLKINTRWMHYLIKSVDQLVIKTIGRIWNRMDGSALLLVWRKGN
jgi:SAM-dependent methyltransferase